MKSILWAFISLLVLSCGTVQRDVSEGNVVNNEIKYAKGFSMEIRDGRTYIDVYNPWSGHRLLASYVFDTISSISSDTQDVIKVPIKKLTSLSSTYLGMIAMLDGRESIIASSNANWIYDSVLYSKYLADKITDLGNDMSISAEAVIADKPDVVVKYIYQSPDPVDQVIEGSGIPIVYIIEFMEEHPLGRAEWIKVIGALLNKKQEADSLFNMIEQSYKKYSSLASNGKNSPSVLCGSIYKGTWYAPGGGSFLASLLKDANADYYWFSDSTTGSLPLSFETVIKNQKDASCWINANAFSMNELIAIEPRSEVFHAFNKGNVYHYNKRVNPNGGLDYYETGVVRPDLLLRDLLIILHPEIMEVETLYYKKLE